MKKFLLFTFLLCYSIINAQISFEKGYFISNDNTKTDCLIKNMDWYANPIDFKYKLDINDNDVKTGTIENVKEFGIENGSIYKRGNVKIDQSSNRLENISTEKNPIWKNDIVFLKILVRGKASLYQYTNTELSRFFYETAETPLEQLVYKEYLNVNLELSSRNVEENNYFKQQLVNNVKSDNTTINDIKRLTYKKDALMKHFLKYNNNNIKTESSEKTVSKLEKGKFHLKITPVLAFSSVSMNGNESQAYRDATYSTKTNFKIGVEAEYVLPINKNKWSFFINPTYQQYSDQKDYGIITSINNSQLVHYPSEIEYSAVSFPLGIRHYMFLNNSSKLFINAAFVFDLGGKYTLKSKPVNIEDKTGQNFAVGLGYNFKNKFSTEFRIYSNKQFPPYSSIATGYYKSIDFILGYSFF